MARIEQLSRAGWRARERKINELVAVVNPLQEIVVRASTAVGQPSISRSTESVVITIPDYSEKISNLQAQIDNLQAQIDSHHP